MNYVQIFSYRQQADHKPTYVVSYLYFKTNKQTFLIKCVFLLTNMYEFDKKDWNVYVREQQGDMVNDGCF